eukprot:1734044-Rhodomonas_salina.1
MMIRHGATRAALLSDCPGVGGVTRALTPYESKGYTCISSVACNQLATELRPSFSSTSSSTKETIPPYSMILYCDCRHGSSIYNFTKTNTR